MDLNEYSKRSKKIKEIRAFASSKGVKKETPKPVKKTVVQKYEDLKKAIPKNLVISKPAPAPEPKAEIKPEISVTEIVDKLNSTEGTLEAKVIKGWPETFDIKDLKIGGKYQLELRDIKGARLDTPKSSVSTDLRYHGGGDVVVAGNNILITTNNSGQKVISTTGGGSVINVSVVSANGFAGSVANPTTTPAITLSTTITGVLKGNGTAISAASDGTDYLSPTTGITVSQSTPQTLGSTGSRLLKLWATDVTVTNTITGSITGNAATATALQNARTIGGVSFDGTAAITVVSATGGFTVSGGALALGANNLTMTGSLAATGARVTKGWFTDLESTNIPTVGGVAILTSLTAPQFTTIELGAASDTTLARVSAGKISVEGVNVVTISSSDSLTNKTITSSTNSLGGVTMALGSDADGDIYYRSSNVLTRLPKGSALQQLRINAGATAPEWATISGGTTVLTLTPKPNWAIGTGTAGISGRTFDTNTTGYVSQFVVTASIVVNKLSFNCTGASVSGTVKIGIFSEDGQTQLVNVTTATISGSAVITTTVPSVTLNSGNYYVMVIPVSTANVDVSMYANPGSGSANLNGLISGKPILNGTYTVTASTMPATITPTSVIDGGTASQALIFRVDN